MGQDSIHALWVDPLAFDAASNGPPYLPEGKIVQASGGVLTRLRPFFADLRVWELGALVGVLRAASVVHQSHHWQTFGPSYYGDHQLFERIYNESLGFIDAIAERAVGLEGPDLVCPKTLAVIVEHLVTMWCDGVEPPQPKYMVATSFSIEVCVGHCIKEAKDSLASLGQLSEGTDNLLQGVADKHEEFVYLLKQRLRGDSTDSYDYR